MKKIMKLMLGIALGISFITPLTSCGGKISIEELQERIEAENEKDGILKYSYDKEDKLLTVNPDLTKGATECILPDEFLGYPIEHAHIEFTNTLKSIHFGKYIKYLEVLPYTKEFEQALDRNAFYAKIEKNIEKITIDKENSCFEVIDNCLIETYTNSSNNEVRELILGTANSKIPEDVQSIGAQAFAYTDIKAITIPKNISSISCESFSYCASLTKVNFEGEVPNLSPYAFYGCKSLTEAYFNKDQTNIPTAIYALCESLTSVTIPEGINRLEAYAFYNCKNLTSLSLPSTLTSIQYSAFKNTNLQNIDFGNSITYIDEDAIDYYGESLVLPDSLESIAQNAFYAPKLKSLVLSKNIESIYEAGICAPLLEKLYYHGAPDYKDLSFIEEDEYLKQAKLFYFTENGKEESKAGDWWYYDLDGNIVEIIVE